MKARPLAAVVMGATMLVAAAPAASFAQEPSPSNDRQVQIIFDTFPSDGECGRNEHFFFFFYDVETHYRYDKDGRLVSMRVKSVTYRNALTGLSATTNGARFDRFKEDQALFCEFVERKLGGV